MSFDLCAIGNACIDVVAEVGDDFLRGRGFKKSICTYLTLEQAEDLLSALPAPSYIPGGCGANTAAVISALGGKTAFIGRLAKDDIGAMFLDDLKKRGISFTGQPDGKDGAGSTRIFALTTPDAERTFAAYYGVQEDLSEHDLNADMISSSKVLYLDGYALNSTRGQETFLKAADIARAAGNMVAFTPSDLSILDKYESAVSAIADKSDIFLCNEQEALRFCGKDDLSAALDVLHRRFKLGTVTMGKDGVHVFGPGGIRHVPRSSGARPVIDLNGAGDAFAGGFLFGFANGYDLEKSARLGHLCAESIIAHAGARAQGDYRPLLNRLSNA